ncbi:MAG: DUF2274 domain-containing protein [Alphaproteobacteria bacterium]|nr:DUF2274 domain-containing protein [Alphaproteobacteria bacterium]MDE2014830.1 DUF2274 domain-containing protein [Alphaproteobacteria bacterium]
MPELKLAKLPDRTPVKITITVPPDLNAALNQYADYPNRRHVSQRWKPAWLRNYCRIGAGETLRSGLGGLK